MTGKSTDNTVYGFYNVRIRASIATATAVGSAGDETSVEFAISLARSPLCNWVEPTINSLVPVTDCAKYLCPSDFTIYTTGVWGYTYFDGWNDTYTENCFGKNGLYSVDGNAPWIS